MSKQAASSGTRSILGSPDRHDASRWSQFTAWRRTIAAVHAREFLGRKGFVVLWALLAPAALLGFQALLMNASVEKYLLGTSWLLPGMVGLFAMALAADIFSRDEQDKFGDHLACLPVGAPALWFAKVTYLVIASSGYLACILMAYKSLTWLGLSGELHMEITPSLNAIFTAALAVGLSAWLTGMTRQPLLAWLGALMFTCPLWTFGGVMTGDWHEPILMTLMRPQFAAFLLVGITLAAAWVYRPGSDRGMRLRRVAPGVILLAFVATTSTAWGHHYLMEDLLHETVRNVLQFRASPDGRFLVVNRYQETKLHHRWHELSLENHSECRVLDLVTREHQSLPSGDMPNFVMIGSWRAPWWDAEGNLLTMGDESVLYRNDLESGKSTVAQPEAILEEGGWSSLRSQASAEFGTWFQVIQSPNGVQYTFDGHLTKPLGGFRGAPLETPGHFVVVEDEKLKCVNIATGDEAVWIEGDVWEFARPHVSPCGRWFAVSVDEYAMKIFDSRTGGVLGEHPGFEPVVGWSKHPGRLLITICGWFDESGAYHEVPDLAYSGRIRAEVGPDQILLQIRGEDRQERFELYSIQDGSRTPLSLDDFGFETLTTGSIQ